jgi:hypothetical protein
VKRGRSKKMGVAGGYEKTFRKWQSNKADIIKHVNIQNQVSIQTWKTHEGTVSGG